jgi:RNA polymerase II-associated protein 1
VAQDEHDVLKATSPERPSIQLHSPMPKSPTRPALSAGHTRPSSRADRKIRFAEVQPQDVHVYESAPPSPRRKVLALPPPTADDKDVQSLGSWKGSVKSLTGENSDSQTDNHGSTSFEEGTPEDIRRRFFPSAPVQDPSLEWISSAVPSSSARSTGALRFDLHGVPISPALSNTLPTHLGLHHHAEGTQAGYTLEDAFVLVRSTVAAQRAAMLGLLKGVTIRLGVLRRQDDEALPGLSQEERYLMSELNGKEEELRSKILAAALDMMSEHGGLGSRAIEVIWECIVGWDPHLVDIEGIELQLDSPHADIADANSSDNKVIDAIASVPLDYILPRISDAFGTAELPRESLVQLLAILHRLAQHSNATASAIVSSPSLVTNMIRTFLLTAPSSADAADIPEPIALHLLVTLASTSRKNAQGLVEPADALLRFVATLPTDSPYGPALGTVLLTGTLRFYASLASYGMYTNVVTTASEPFTRLGQYILALGTLSRGSRDLVVAWIRAVEVWMVCARDPHQTTPPHDLLWSQVAGWGWGEDIIELRGKWTADEPDKDAWPALWNAEAAWLEGSRVNSIRAGEKEREEMASAVRSGFAEGMEGNVVHASLVVLQGLLADVDLRSSLAARPKNIADWRDISAHAGVLAAAVRLWLSCLPAKYEGSLQSPPFSLPFEGLSAICAKIVTHPLWSLAQDNSDTPHIIPFLRPLSTLLGAYLRMSRWLPHTTPDLWLAQALAILCRQLPGDEEISEHIVQDAVSLVSQDFLRSQGWAAPQIIWDRGGMSVAAPLLEAAIRAKPLQELYIAPIVPTIQSIKFATTLRIPREACKRVPSSTTTPTVGLALTNDWVFSPLDHLLRSGTSEVMRSLPSSWEASETEVVRAVFLFHKVAREVLLRHSLDAFVPDCNEVVFACMKVFMLEHEQAQDETAEVYRDGVVGQLMSDILTPYSLSAITSRQITLDHSNTLETVAARFLGASTPFYQYYTDFVALYDAVSFSHALFARLLLPPLATRYALDYRKLLWNDYAHALRTVRTPIGDVPCVDAREFLYPIEQDAQMIAAYLRGLVRGGLEGFLRFVAVHHVASSIWPDSRGSDRARQERAEKLLMAVVEQGDHAAVKEVVRYRQRDAEAERIWLVPECFEHMDRATFDLRLDFADSLGGSDMRLRLSGLLGA